MISLYYYEELTMKEIGEVLGITESRVSQIHSKIDFDFPAYTTENLNRFENAYANFTQMDK